MNTQKPTLKTYRIEYQNGQYKTVNAYTALEVIKKYDLATRENINTKLVQVEVL